jgi:hypothetical protein
VRIGLLCHGVFIDGGLVLAHLGLIFSVLAHERLELLHLIFMYVSILDATK